MVMLMRSGAVFQSIGTAQADIRANSGIKLGMILDDQQQMLLLRLVLVRRAVEVNAIFKMPHHLAGRGIEPAPAPVVRIVARPLVDGHSKGGCRQLQQPQHLARSDRHGLVKLGAVDV